MKPWQLGVILVVAIWVAWIALRPPGEPPIIDLHAIPMWVPILLSSGLGAAAGWSALGGKVVGAIRSASLKKEMAALAAKQVESTPAATQAEVAALNARLSEAIDKLERSSLARGGRRAALYTLPWYLMVGPPGAGKTTAIAQSGLPFPYHDERGIAGVGGTRNCDLWLSNNGILVDTAGRYASEETSHSEWMAFLGLLRKHRPDAPINGVIVAVPVDLLLDESEEPLEKMAIVLRRRVDELSTALGMVLPVYILFTKSDLISGLVESFGSLTRAQRSQPWGVTFAESGASDADVSKELDLLVTRLYTHTLRRLKDIKNAQEAAKVLDFPREFAGISGRVMHFWKTFGQGGGRLDGEPPILRGFYFTSGTQEGRPFERLATAMRTAFGLGSGLMHEDRLTEKKSYFLRDVFEKIIFPEAALAERSAAFLKRERMKGAVFAAVSWGFSFLCLVLVGMSFLNNRRLLDRVMNVTVDPDVQRASLPSSASTERWTALDKLAERVAELDEYAFEGPPIALRWGLYSGGKVRGPLVAAYTQLFQKATVPLVGFLEQKVLATTGDPRRTVAELENLKAYKLLGEPARLRTDLTWEVEKLNQLAAASLGSEGPSSTTLRRHLELYLKLVSSGAVPPVRLNKAAIAGAEQKLGVQGMIVLRLETVLQGVRDAVGTDGSSKAYPPISVVSLFSGRARVLEIIKGASQVDGVYTLSARAAVVAGIDNAARAVDSEGWIVGSSAERPSNIRGELLRRYDDAYVLSWETFFRGLTVRVRPSSLKADLEKLSAADSPYHALLTALTVNTQPGSEARGGVGTLPSSLGARFGVMAAFGKKDNEGLEEYCRVLAQLAALLGSARDVAAKEQAVRDAKTHVDRIVTRGLDDLGHVLLGSLLRAPVTQAEEVVRAELQAEEVP
ncbi:MAG: type VI secretion system membrane subunit TssM [Polyangiaceae bacterium]|nr:type VI secretion system membrane subunit TssM [Polyangiaceae bacterium]